MVIFEGCISDFSSNKYPESVIDGIPHPELRDKMILLRGVLMILNNKNA